MYGEIEVGEARFTPEEALSWTAWQQVTAHEADIALVAGADISLRLQPLEAWLCGRSLAAPC